MIRRVNSVRGTCVGTVVAVDRHCNLVLSAVTESYVPLAIANGRRAAERKEVARDNKSVTTSGYARYSVIAPSQLTSNPYLDPYLVTR